MLFRSEAIRWRAKNSRRAMSRSPFITDKWTDRPPDRPCVLKDVGFDGRIVTTGEKWLRSSRGISLFHGTLDLVPLVNGMMWRSCGVSASLIGNL